MGATLSCDCCRQAIPQGNGPDETPKVWENTNDPTLTHLCQECWEGPNEPLIEAGGINPADYTKRTAWLIIGQENARRTAAMQQDGPAMDNLVAAATAAATAVPYQTCFWCGMEVAMHADTTHCFRCRRLLRDADGA